MLINGPTNFDDLFQVYPTIPGRYQREIDENRWANIEQAFHQQNNDTLIKELLKSFDLFPLKDSYIAYLKQDIFHWKKSKTINRICGRLFMKWD